MATLRSELAFGKVWERIAAEEYARKRWPTAQIIQNPAYADIDWLVVAPKGDEPALVAALEIKARRIDSKRYESAIVAFRKHDAARFMRTFFKVPTVCLVLYTDTVATFSLAETPAGKELVTRFDREKGVEHALYLHSAFEWHPDVYEAIQARVAEEQ